jgi:hypothetical protein
MTRDPGKKAMIDEAEILRLMAVKWLETAESVEHRELKRCYAKRAMAYEAMAAAARRRAEAVASLFLAPPSGATRH